MSLRAIPPYFVLAAVLAVLLAPAPATACCDLGLEICGTASGSGNVEVAFVIGGDPTDLCTASTVFAVSAGATAEQVCMDLQMALDNQCDDGDPVTRSGYPDGTGSCDGNFPCCEFACYPSTPGCWVLLDEKYCFRCVTQPFTNCCGLDIHYFDPFAP